MGDLAGPDRQVGVPTTPGPLAGLRALDLTGRLGWLLGKILADLGVAVWKLDPPGGDPHRLEPPLLDGPGGRAGAEWVAFNAGKRRLHLDLGSEDGRRQFRELAAVTDFVLDTAEPGALEALGVGWPQLREQNLALVMTSVTPYGQDGPLAHTPASDLELMAAGGAVWLTGDPDRPPVRVTQPQAGPWASAYAAIGTLIAHNHRRATGRGQHVDASAQCAILPMLVHAPCFWELLGVNPMRAGSLLVGRNVHGAAMRNIWACCDGYVTWALYGGPAGRQSNRGLAGWMAERGMAPDFLLAMDWDAFDVATVTPADVERMEGAIEPFFRTVTRAEFEEQARARRLLGYPVATAAEIVRDPQLEARGVWRDVWVPELGRRVRLPTGWYRTTSSRAREPGGTGADSPPARQGGTGAQPPQAGGSEGGRQAPPSLGGCQRGAGDPPRAEPPKGAGPLSSAAGGVWGDEDPPRSERRDPPRSERQREAESYAPGGSSLVPPGHHRHRPPLVGLKVVEFGGWAAGPAIGKHLGDHGAEVVHVESRLRLDGFRTNYPPYAGGRPGLERAAMFAITNNDKLGVTLNLKAPGAHRVAVRLIERADVVIENFTPGTMARLGLGHDAMSERNPGLIMLSTCNQGATGPHADRAGFGTHLTALSGFTYLTGWPDRAPALLWGPFIDYVAVAYGAVAVLAALEERSRTGLGCHVDLSQYETGVQLMAPVLAARHAGGRVLDRAGNRHPSAVPHGVFPCAGAERWCALSVHDDGEWERLRAALGDPDWAADPALDGADGRRAAEALLEERIAGWTRARPREEVVHALRAARVHVAPVNDMGDLFADPQLAWRRAFRSLEHPEMGPHSVPGPSFVLPEAPDRIGSPAPLLGQHNRRVLCGILGLGEDDVACLEADGALR